MPEETQTDKAQIDPFQEGCFGLRKDIENLKPFLRTLKADALASIDGLPEDPIDSPEISANLQLAYRHLEDARMRIGKALQAYDGGNSCYPR